MLPYCETLGLEAGATHTQAHTCAHTDSTEAHAHIINVDGKGGEPTQRTATSKGTAWGDRQTRGDSEEWNARP